VSGDNKDSQDRAQKPIVVKNQNKQLSEVIGKNPGNRSTQQTSEAEVSVKNQVS
jgi:hypothetical protein